MSQGAEYSFKCRLIKKNLIIFLQEFPPTSSQISTNCNQLQQNQNCRKKTHRNMDINTNLTTSHLSGLVGDIEGMKESKKELYN